MLSLLLSALAQASLVRSILNTSSNSDEILSDAGESSSEHDLSAGWALLTEAQLPLQLEIGRLLLSKYGYRLLLLYRGNRNGSHELQTFAQAHAEQVMAVKMQHFNEDATVAAITARCQAIEVSIVLGDRRACAHRIGCS